MSGIGVNNVPPDKNIYLKGEGVRVRKRKILRSRPFSPCLLIIIDERSQQQVLIVVWRVQFRVNVYIKPVTILTCANRSALELNFGRIIDKGINQARYSSLRPRPLLVGGGGGGGGGHGPLVSSQFEIVSHSVDSIPHASPTWHCSWPGKRINVCIVSIRQESYCVPMEY